VSMVRLGFNPRENDSRKVFQFGHVRAQDLRGGSDVAFVIALTVYRTSLDTC
jgi:hypothetical protein